MARKKRGSKSRPIQLATSSAPEPPTNKNGAPATSTLPQCAPTDIEQMPDDVYCKERDILLDLIKANTEQHHKWVLQLAAAALGLSVTFIEKIAKAPGSDTYIWLGAGWSLLSFSIAAMLLSFLVGEKACWNALEALDAHYQNRVPLPARNILGTITHLLNRASYASFVIGVICIVRFSWHNLPTGGSDDMRPTAVTRTSSEPNPASATSSSQRASTPMTNQAKSPPAPQPAPTTPSNPVTVPGHAPPPPPPPVKR